VKLYYLSPELWTITNIYELREDSKECNGCLDIGMRQRVREDILYCTGNNALRGK